MATPTVPSSETSQIIESLRSQANSILGSVLSTPLQAFTVSGLGNFPYYWTNPTNLEFNNLTYGWINANLAANTTPVEQDQTFSGYFIEALGSISYQLSASDQAALTKAQQNATNQQAALLAAWKSAYGSIPAATNTQQPIDIILNTIATTWARPATTLMAMQTSKNLFQLLNNMPASGKAIAPVLSQYLNALGSAISLQNATTMNTGYVQQALANVQAPSTSNGGLTTDDGVIHPAYAVATQLSTIINGLSATSNAATLAMTVQRTSSTQYTVSVNGGTSFQIPILDFFSLGVSSSASYFQDQIATSSNTISITMKFTGITLVNFGPVAFDLSTGLNWYWTLPVTQALANGSSGVSGFVFSPNPNIDFSTSGPFGFISGVAISNYPSVSITVSGSNYESIQKTFQSQTSVSLSFLGIPLGGGSVSNYSNSVSTDASNQSVTITLDPPPELVAGTSTSSVGWVLGVQTQYPGATS
jgi:hypothetical protein